MISFCVSILLRPVLEENLSIDDQIEEELKNEDTSLIELDEEEQQNDIRPGVDMKTRKALNNKQKIDNMLDMDGPKLIDGARLLLDLYQLLGNINWLNKPLYVSVIYKIFLIILSTYSVVSRVLIPVTSIDTFKSHYNNPIFMLFWLSALIVSGAMYTVSLYTNLFNLSPLFQILNTPKLCYLNSDVKKLFGDETVKGAAAFLIYETILMEMIRSRNLAEFMENFTFLGFIYDLFSQAVIWSHFIGMFHYDFYIRCCFGCWCLAMKQNVETRLERFQVYQRIRLIECLREFNLKPRRSHDEEQVNHGDDDQDNKFDHVHHIGLKNKSVINISKFITLDEIQDNLNRMDDHLEVWRSIQTTTFVLLTVNAFLANGTMFLSVYKLLANESDYYHGFISLAAAINFWVVIFFCYSGDQWISYSLHRFVQTVEDEYFLQGADNQVEKLTPDYEQLLGVDQSELPAEVESAINELTDQLIAQHKTLLIKKKDVLFCREFLHQFDNHIATPWSKLTFGSHIHMLGTFFTLIAAQIIFDTQH